MHGRFFLGYLLLAAPSDASAPTRRRLIGRIVDLGATPDGQLVLIARQGSYLGRHTTAVPWRSVRHWQVGRVEVGTPIPRDLAMVPLLGRQLGQGIVTDLHFSPRSGCLEGFELSKGILHDLFHGRSFVPYRPGGESSDLSRLWFEGNRTRRA